MSVEVLEVEISKLRLNTDNELSLGVWTMSLADLEVNISNAPLDMDTLRASH